MKRLSVEEVKQLTVEEKHDVKIRVVGNSKGNPKTGPISQTYNSEITCPCRCPFRCSGCYGESVNTARCWCGCDNGKGIKPEDLQKATDTTPLTKMIRLNIAGDIAVPGTNEIDDRWVNAYIESFNNKKVFGYTHCEINKENIEKIKKLKEHGIVFSFSCETVEQVKKAFENNCDAVMTVETMEDRVKVVDGIKFVKCPNVTTDGEVKCCNCGICTKPNRNFVIVFPLHGNGKGKAKRTGIFQQW